MISDEKLQAMLLEMWQHGVTSGKNEVYAKICSDETGQRVAAKDVDARDRQIERLMNEATP